MQPIPRDQSLDSTLALMKRALRLLTTSMSYEVPAQDLRIRRSPKEARPEVIGSMSCYCHCEHSEAISPLQQY